MTKLIAYNGERKQYRDGEDVLNDLFDFIRKRIPEMHPSDPTRVCLSQLAPYLGERLERPTVELVGKDVT